MPTWAVVLTSAGVAALVSGAMALVGQAIERRWRHRELALTKALELATARAELARLLASETLGRHDHDRGDSVVSRRQLVPGFHEP